MNSSGLRPERHPGMVLALILVSYFMIVLDNSIIFTGLPEIQTALGLGATSSAWVQNAYTLVFGGLLLLGARIGDLLGRQRVFVVGLAIFGLASLLVGTAQNEVWLIAARAFQGIGAAIVAPTSLSLITAPFPAGPQRTRAVAAYGTTAGLGASLGLLVGGALASWVSWRAGFFINGPIAGLMIVGAVRYLPHFPREQGRFDVWGALASTVGMGALVFGIINAGETGWGSVNTLVPLLVGALVLGLFVANEARVGQPIMPLRLFASRQRGGAAIARLMFAGTMIAFFFFLTQFFQGVYGWTPLQAGLGFLPMTLVQFVLSLFVPRLTRRFGNAALVAVGLGLVFAGIAWMSQLSADSSYLMGAVGPLVIIGLGQGIAFGPITAAGIAGARAEDAGAASGVVNTAHQLGSTLGVAILTSVAASASTLEGRVTSAFAGGAVMMAIALVATLALIVPAEVGSRRLSRVIAADEAEERLVAARVLEEGTRTA